MKSHGKNVLIGVRDIVFGSTIREWWENAFWLAVSLSIAFLWRSRLHSMSLTLAATAITYIPLRSLFWMLSKRRAVYPMTIENGSATAYPSLRNLILITRELKSKLNHYPKRLYLSPSDYREIYNEAEPCLLHHNERPLPLGADAELYGVSVKVSRWLEPGISLYEMPDGRLYSVLWGEPDDIAAN